MKKRILLFNCIVFVILLAGCTGSEGEELELETAMQTPEPAAKEYQFNYWLSKPEYSTYGYSGRLSHNGNWYVNEIAPTFSIASLTYPFRTFQFDELASIGDTYYGFRWSPNHAFLYASHLISPEKSCARENFYILEEQNGQMQIRSKLDKPIDESEECLRARWLWDGTEIAFIDNPHDSREVFTTNVYDMNAQLVQSYSYTVTEEDRKLFPGGTTADTYPE